MLRWFSTLRAQFVAVTFVAVILSNFAVVYLFEIARESEVSGVRLSAVVDRIGDTFDFLAAIPVAQRDPAVHALTRARYRYTILTANPFPGHVMSADEKRMADDMISGQRMKKPGSIIVRLMKTADGTEPAASSRATDAPAFEVAQQITPGLWILVHWIRAVPPPNAPDMLIAAALGTILTCAAAAWLAGRVSRPLSALAYAADEVARGRPAPRLDAAGPDDLRRAAEAFNEMSDRVARTLASHRQLLSAVGHDLRTPIAAMRISAEFVEDQDVRVRLSRSLDELQSLTEAVLSAARAAPGEKTRRIDLAALIQSVCDDLTDLGLPVEVNIEGSAPCLCRPNEIRRAARNLIENAVRYGGSAVVKLDTDRDFFVTRIEDSGPGIPEKRLEEVFQPFVRLEESRSFATGGTGLGLTLARTVAREHGGDVMLENRQDEFGRIIGLRASLSLPREESSRGRPAPDKAARPVIAPEPVAS